MDEELVLLLLTRQNAIRELDDASRYTVAKGKRRRLTAVEDDIERAISSDKDPEMPRWRVTGPLYSNLSRYDN